MNGIVNKTTVCSNKMEQMECVAATASKTAKQVWNEAERIGVNRNLNVLSEHIEFLKTKIETLDEISSTLSQKREYLKKERKEATQKKVEALQLLSEEQIKFLDDCGFDKIIDGLQKYVDKCNFENDQNKQRLEQTQLKYSKLFDLPFNKQH